MDHAAIGDMDGDRTDDAAVALRANGGGTGIFFEPAVMLSRDGKPVWVATASKSREWYSDVKSVRIKRGVILVRARIHTEPHDFSSWKTARYQLKIRSPNRFLIIRLKD